MIINKLYLKKFGKFTDKNIELGEGLNIINGKNEAGKSTIAAFIRFMLYGVPKVRATRENPLPDKDKYMPWDGDGTASGSLYINYMGKNIVIEREFRKNINKKPKVYDELTGEPLNIFDNAEPGKVMFDITAETFERTAFIRQSDIEVNEFGELEIKLRNLVTGADENVSYASAKGFLETLRRKLENARSGGIIPELKSKIENLKLELLKSSETQNEWLNTQNKLKEAENKRIKVENSVETYKNELNLAKAYIAYDKYLRIKTAKEEQNEILIKAEILSNGITVSGYIPDEDFIAKLRQSAHDLRLEEERLLMCGKDIVEGQNTIDRIKAQERDFSSLSKDYENALEKLKSAPTTRTRILLPAGGVAAGVGILGLTAYLLMGRSPLLLLSTILLFVAGCVLIVLNFLIKRPNNPESIARSYGYKSSVELSEALGHLSQIRNEINSAIINYKEAKQRETNQRAICSKIKDKLLLFCVPRGLSQVTPSGVDLLCVDIEENLKKIAILNSKVEILNERISGILDGMTENELISLAQKAPSEKPRELFDIENDLDISRNEFNNLNLDVMQLNHKSNSIFQNQKTPSILTDEIEEKKLILKNQNANLNACDISLAALYDAFSELQMTFAPELNKRAGEVFSQLLSHQMRELLMDSNANVRVKEDGVIREIGYYSAGTRDAAYLAVRLSAAGLIFKDEYPPLIFDDSFSRFDNERLQAMVNTLNNKAVSFQTLVFTCREEEKSILGVNAKVINL